MSLITLRKAEKAKDLFKTLDKTRINVKDITKGNSLPNYEVNMTKEQFEKHLLENGYRQKPNGPVDLFSKKGNKEFVTRNKSRTKDDSGKDRPTADLYIKNKKEAEIRFQRDNGN